MENCVCGLIGIFNCDEKGKSRVTNNRHTFAITRREREALIHTHTHNSLLSTMKTNDYGKGESCKMTTLITGNDGNVLLFCFIRYFCECYRTENPIVYDVNENIDVFVFFLCDFIVVVFLKKKKTRKILFCVFFVYIILAVWQKTCIKKPKSEIYFRTITTTSGTPHRGSGRWLTEKKYVLNKCLVLLIK